MLGLAIVSLCLIPLGGIVDDHCDVIELNHVFTSDGEHSLSQHIFWEWDSSTKGFRVVAWRLWKPGMPTIEKLACGDVRLTFQDGDTLRRVTAKQYRESWYQTDIEVRDRCIRSCKARRGLTRRFCEHR